MRTAAALCATFIIRRKAQERSTKRLRGWLVAFAAGVDSRSSCQHGKGSKFEEDALHVDGGHRVVEMIDLAFL